MVVNIHIKNRDISTTGTYELLAFHTVELYVPAGHLLSAAVFPELIFTL